MLGLGGCGRSELGEYNLEGMAERTPTPRRLGAWTRHSRAGIYCDGLPAIQLLRWPRDGQASRLARLCIAIDSDEYGLLEESTYFVWTNTDTGGVALDPVNNCSSWTANAVGPHVIPYRQRDAGGHELDRQWSAQLRPSSCTCTAWKTRADRSHTPRARRGGLADAGLAGDYADAGLGGEPGEAAERGAGSAGRHRRRSRRRRHVGWHGRIGVRRRRR
jgi:hypothetical protein